MQEENIKDELAHYFDLYFSSYTPSSSASLVNTANIIPNTTSCTVPSSPPSLTSKSGPMDPTKLSTPSSPMEGVISKLEAASISTPEKSTEQNKSDRQRKWDLNRAAIAQFVNEELCSFWPTSQAKDEFIEQQWLKRRDEDLLYADDWSHSILDDAIWSQDELLKKIILGVCISSAMVSTSG